MHHARRNIAPFQSDRYAVETINTIVVKSMEWRCAQRKRKNRENTNMATAECNGVLPSLSWVLSASGYRAVSKRTAASACAFTPTCNAVSPNLFVNLLARTHYMFKQFAMNTLRANEKQRHGIVITQFERRFREVVLAHQHLQQMVVQVRNRSVDQ